VGEHRVVPQHRVFALDQVVGAQDRRREQGIVRNSHEVENATTSVPDADATSHDAATTVMRTGKVNTCAPHTASPGGIVLAMPRKTATARRAEVLDETLTQIRALGMAAVRVADVAEASGVSPALIIYHFGTKENLLSEALVHACAQDLSTVDSVVGGPGSPPDRLMAALDWYSPTGPARGWTIWIDAWSVALRDRALARVVTDLQRRWIDVIAAVIDEGVAAGLFPPADSAAVAARLTSYLDGLAVRSVVHKARPPRRELRATLIRQVAWELSVSPEVFAGA
jgi:AcrR family transcriptional regulator